MKTTSKEIQRHAAVVDGITAVLPHLSAWLEDEDSFRAVRVVARDDGTYLGIAKGYGPDGGKLVCFGVGYGAFGAFYGLDRAIQGGAWRVDTPWEPKGE